MKKETPIIVLCTCTGSISAKKISQEVITAQLATCVNIIPNVVSYFRWSRQIEKKEENLLIIKTIESVFPALEACILKLHDYDVPEILVIPVQTGNDKYLDWLKKNILD